MDLPWIKAFMDTRRTEAAKIQADWSPEESRYWPGKDELKRAALLAWEWSLTSVKEMNIMNKSIKDIPRDQMEKLTSIVTKEIYIDNMIHANQLGGILASVKCPQLMLLNMELSKAETRALVTAMRDGVQRVELWVVYLDIEELTKYDGSGRCKELRIREAEYGDEERLTKWAEDKGWTAIGDDWEIEFQRK